MMDSEFTGETIVTQSHERVRPVEPEITRDAPDADRVTTFCVGQAVHRYVLLSRLGRGGMGEVWKAFDPELNRALAI